MKLTLPVFMLAALLASHPVYAAKRTAQKAPQAAAGAMVAGEARDCVGNSCAVSAAVSCDDEPDAEACNVQPTYGGIKQQYVVKGCQVTIYNDGPVKMVNEKTGEWCDAPIPKDHSFNPTSSNPTQSLPSAGTCSISEAAADSAGAADCGVAPKKTSHRH